MVNFFRFLGEIFASALDDGESTAKRTLCCDALMWDLWMHTKTCPNFNARLDKIKAWRAANPNVPLEKMPHSVNVSPRGDKDMCPRCGFPAVVRGEVTAHFGVYIVGEKCAYCAYVEKRFDRE